MEKIEDILQEYINEAKAGRGLAVTRKDLEDAVRQIRMTRPPRPEPLSAEEREKRRIGFTPMEQMQAVRICALQAEVARLKDILMRMNDDLPRVACSHFSHPTEKDRHADDELCRPRHRWEMACAEARKAIEVKHAE